MRPQEGLEAWRKLTSTSSPTPRVFVHRDNVRFYFPSEKGITRFEADWRRERVPGRTYRVNSAKLRVSPSTAQAPTRESSWREATVIGGTEWQRFATNLILALTPSAPGRGASYQALMPGRVLYRDAAGVPHVAACERVPADIQIEQHFSPDGTLETVATCADDYLRRAHPGKTLFLVMGPSASWFPQPLLLDQARKECVSLSLAGLTHSPEDKRTFGMAAEGTRVMLQGHGVALLKNPVSSAARLVDLVFQTTLKTFMLPLPKGSPQLPPPGQAQGMALGRWETWLDKYTGTRLEDGALDLQIDGERFFTRFERAIAEATNHVYLRSYIFGRDEMAVGIADQLKQRSSEVDMRLILDRMGTLGGRATPLDPTAAANFSPPPNVVDYLRDGSAVRVRYYWNPWFSFDHSKLYLVDGHRAWLGGMNIGREYRYEWHDLMVEVTGPVVFSFENEFRRNWAHAGPLGDLAYVAAILSQPGAPTNTVCATNDWVKLRRLPTKTNWKPFGNAVLGAIRKARRYIYIENPYLFDKHVIRELVQARRRGVDVRVIMPRVNDLKPGYSSNLVTANYLRDHGIRVFFYPGMTHVKALLVDDWACVGSGNLNHLSLRICREENIATSDPGFAGRLKTELFEKDFTQSYELSERLSVDWADFLADLMVKTF